MGQDRRFRVRLSGRVLREAACEVAFSLQLPGEWGYRDGGARGGGQ